VKAAAEALSKSVDRYVFISTQNVYADISVPGVKEDAPLASLTTEQLDRANAMDTSGQPSYAELYGGLKALCEQAVEEAMPGRVFTVRPGLIVGPNDYTDRFTYWPVRVARGGEVLAPGRPDRFIRFIDARDLAEWMLKMVEGRAIGAFNANGPISSLTMQGLLDECRQVSASDASFTWASEEFLLQEKVAPWSEMPLWLPEDVAPHLKGFMFVNCDKAVRAGLQCRSTADTVRDTLAWYQANHAGEELKAGITEDRERSLLELLKNR